MTGRTRVAPPVVLVYGLLGIIPFWSLPAATRLCASRISASIQV
jgi:hypothetical protein